MFRRTSAVAVQKALEGITLRQQAIADNIANAETPGHRPRRVMFEAALRAAIRNEKEAQAQGRPERAVEGVTPRVRRAPVIGGYPSATELETEMTGLAKASLHYEALSRVLAKQFRMLRTAISGGTQ